ncbi:MAG TPA: hypothetical protein DCR20_00355 [Planctomycetaceae bacterium]|jgi:hypothetical protein|nr:hypothetical protein [Planctomycetaceae bacterium]
MQALNRRRFLAAASAAVAATTTNSGLILPASVTHAAVKPATADSLPMQLYKSLTDEQRAKVCLPADHPRRQYVSNWWYIHPDYRIPATFNADQQELIQQIFDSLHNEQYIADVKKQVRLDQYGQAKNAPAAGFFGTPDSPDFEFIYTGHHVTRRCNAHSDKGSGFGGAPIFYGHYPHSEENMRDNFNEASDHPGNMYWYQGRIFNQFVQGLTAEQQATGLVSGDPRSEDPEQVILKTDKLAGLPCSTLTKDQQQLFLDTMKRMLAMFRADDVTATMQIIEERRLIEQLHVSWFAGRYDIGNDQVWDTWQIESPEMVWYFRGQPHIHAYFHLKK